MPLTEPHMPDRRQKKGLHRHNKVVMHYSFGLGESSLDHRRREEFPAISNIIGGYLQAPYRYGLSLSRYSFGVMPTIFLKIFVK